MKAFVCSYAQRKGEEPQRNRRRRKVGVNTELGVNKVKRAREQYRG